MWSRFYLLAVFLHAVVALNKDCPQPCIPIDDCPDLIKLIRTDVKVVQDATCRFGGAGEWTPLVCCPSTHEPLKSTTATTILDPAVPHNRNSPKRNSLLPERCGDSLGGLSLLDDRVFGGETAPIGAYQWMAALGYNNAFSNKIDFMCSGSVINERYILTAAHCLDRKLAVIRLGEWDLSTEVDCERSDLLGIEVCGSEPEDVFEFETVIHPQYRKRGEISDDIALIRLARPISFNVSSVQPVCLPERDLDVPVALGFREALAMGWGITEEGVTSNRLLQVSLPHVDIESCNSTYDNLLVGNQLCFGGTAGKDTCASDSGGPVVMSNFNAPPYTQIGIVSFGPRRCGQDGVPGVYTSVANYRDWIDENMRP